MSSPISLPGLSGYDFTGIVGQMVEIYRMPETQMIKTESKFTVQKEAWREINTRLSALNTASFNLRLASNWSAANATSSNTELLTATANAGTASGTYNIQIQNLAQAQTSASNSFADQNAILNLTGSFEIRDSQSNTKATITVAATDSLATIAKNINNAKVGVTASVLQVNGSYTLAVNANKTGSANSFSFQDSVGSTVASDLGLLNPPKQAAIDAKISINGITNITSSSNTFKDVIPGVTFNLHGSDGGATTITLSVGADNSVAKKAVQDFIDKYNSAVDFIAEKLSYDKETKKTGILFADPILQGIQARLRKIVTADLNNPTAPYTTLSSVGIKTISSQDAKLTLNEAKFTQALENNAQSVANLFSAQAGGITPKKYNAAPLVAAEGLANILDAYLEPMVKYGGSLSKKLDGLDGQIKDIGKRIDAFEDRVEIYEANLKKRFASLESMLSQMSSQSSWLSNQMAMMTKSTDK